jgi:two-component system, cell cycle sensor histidine kinase and response regulator CckA
MDGFMSHILSCLAGRDDPRLITLAAVIGVLASLAAISLFHRARATSGEVRAAWTATAGAVAGCGMWAAHFIAMLAFAQGIPIDHDVGLTVLSLAAVMATTGVGLGVAVYGAGGWSPPVSGLVLGAGLSAMQAVGVAALSVPGRLSWSLPFVLLALALACALAAAAMMVATRPQGTRRIVHAAALLSAALIAQHVTAICPVDVVLDPLVVIASPAVPPTLLAVIIAGAVAAVLGMALVGASMDRRLADRTLRLHAALDNMSQGLVMLDAGRRLVLCNRRFVEIYGLSPEAAAPGRLLREILPPGAAAAAADQDGGGHTVHEAGVVALPDGRFILVSDQPMANGGWVSTHEDITRRRQGETALADAREESRRAEQEARAAHARLREAFEVVPEALALFDADDRYVLWNRRYLELYSGSSDMIAQGVRFEDVLRAGLKRGQYPEAIGCEEEWLADRLARHRAPQNSHEQSLPDDRWVRVEERRTADGGSIGIRVDISEVKRREASFRLLFESNPISMWVVDRNSLEFLDVNAAALAHYGYSREHFLEMSLLDIRPAQDWDEIRALTDAGGGDATGRSRRHLRRDGTEIEVAVFTRFLRYGGRDAALTAAIDLTERKRVEDELRRTQRFLDTIVENMPTTLIVKDARSLRLVMANKAAEDLFGIPRVDLIGKTGGDALGQVADAFAPVAGGNRAGQPSSSDPARRIDTPHKGMRDIVTKRIILCDEGGRPEYILAVVEDVTERKRAEDELRRAQEFLNAVIENVPTMLFAKEARGQRYVLVNRAGEQLLGISRDEMIGKTDRDLFPEAQASLSSAREREVLEADRVEAVHMEAIHTHHSGVRLVITRRLVIPGSDGTPEYLLGVIEDVTERKRAEDDLRRTRSFLDTVIENVPATIIVKEASGDRRYVLVNRAGERLFGLSREQVIGKTAFDCFAPRRAELIDARDRHLLARGEQVFDEDTVEMPGGENRHLTSRRLLIRGEDETPQYLLVVIDDVTEQRRAKEQLIEANETLQAVINASPVAIVGTGPSGVIMTWSGAAENIFGFTAEEAIGSALTDLVPPADSQERFGHSIAGAFAGARVRGLVEQRRRKDGIMVDVQVAAAPVYAEDGAIRHVVVAIEDITRRKALEDQLRQAQKMEAIGQLTGGLSHDFNNLLAIIIGNLDLLRAEIGWNADAAELLDEALQASLQGADLNRRLLAFARRQPLQPKQVDLNDLIAGTAKLLRRTLGEHIEVALAMSSDLWPVRVDPTQLESALTNLAVNARDAMPGGGRLTISTRNIGIDEDYAASQADVTPGDFAVLEVSDTGIGMPPDVVARVFEPFFTTKGKEKGTGLGLSMVFGFVKQSGGHVQVYSEVGVGTTLRIYLPRTEGATNEAAATTTLVAPRGHETVLAVEDNEGLRRLLVKQLADLGYRVLEAATAPAAIEILKRKDKIDLLFTDIVLPGGMNGWELARAAAELRDDLKVLFTSGFPEAVFGPDGVLPQGASLLSKPYRSDELARRLRESLAA